MANTVIRIEDLAFWCCTRLVFVRLSRNLEFIGEYAFQCCNMTSIFIPPSCREIGNWTFMKCESLLILGLPQHVQLGQGVFKYTALMKKSPIEVDEDGNYDSRNEDIVMIRWIKSINNGEAYALHRASASYNPLSEIIHALVKRHGIKAMRMPNTIGITPSQYLEEANTFVDISEKEIINRYILDMMGENV